MELKNMKRSNVILQAAIASAFLGLAGGVQAGTITQAANLNKYATETFGNATSTFAITSNPFAYVFNTPGGIVVNSTGSVYLSFRLSAGTFAAAPAAGEFTLSAGVVLVAQTPILSGDSTTVVIPLKNTTASNQTIGIGGTVTWDGTTTIKGLASTLAVAGGTATVQGATGSNGATAPNTGTALVADLDNGLSNSLAFAVGTQAITTAVASSSTFAVSETQKVDLTATSPGSRFTAPGITLSNANSTTLVNLGSVTFTEITGNQWIQTGAADYTIATRGTANTLGGTVTGSFKTGATLDLYTDLACTTLLGTGATTLNAGLTTFTSTGYPLPATTVASYLCMTAPATTGSIPLGTPTATFTFTKTTTTDSATTASGSLYTLANNGSIVDVRNYVPAAVTGWNTIIRVINTGTVAADISAALIDETTGTVGTGTVVITAMPSGAATTINAATLEGMIGAVPADARPRIRISGPTNGLDVQTYVFNPNGNFSIIHGKE